MVEIEVLGGLAVAGVTSSSESSVITFRFFIAGPDVLPFDPVMISLNDCG